MIDLEYGRCGFSDYCGPVNVLGEYLPEFRTVNSHCAVGRDHGNVYQLVGHVVGQDELEGSGACFSQLLHSANITAAIGVFPASGISRGDTGNKRLAAAQ